MSTGQVMLDEAFVALSQGKLSDAEAKLDLSIKEARAKADMSAIFSACCVRASIDAMSGKDVSHVFSDVRIENLNYGAALANYFDGLSLLSKGNLHSAKLKFTVAKNQDKFFILANVGLAAVSFQSQEYKECFSLYREVLGELGSTIVPPIVRVGMGLCAYQLNQSDYAVKALERALEVNPEDELALLALFVVYADQRKIGKVSEIVARLSKLVSYNPLVWLKAGDLMYFKALGSGNVKKYIEPLRQLLAGVREAGSTEDCALANFQEGRLLIAAGAYEEARALLKSALDCFPQMLAAEIHFARLLLLTGEHGLAVAHLQKINERYPNQKEVLQLLAARFSYDGNHEYATQLAFLLTSSVAQGDLQSFMLASWCFRVNSAECRRCTSNVINIMRSEKKTASWQLLSNMASLNHDAGGLQAIVDRELDGNFLNQPLKDTLFVPLIYNLALELEKKDRTRAKQLYLYLVREQSCFAAPYIRLHLMAKEDGLLKQSVAWMTLLLKVVPEDAMALVYLAEVYLEQGKYQAATRILRRVKTKSLPVALALGSTLLQCCQISGADGRECLAAARDRFQYVLKEDEGNILAVHGLACCLGVDEDKPQCQLLLERVSEVIPNCEYVLQNHLANMSNVKVLTESYKQAIDYFDKQVDRSAEQNSMLAFCLSREGRYGDALPLITRVAEAGAGRPMFSFNASLLHFSAFIDGLSRHRALTLEEGQKLKDLLEKGIMLARRTIAAVRQQKESRSYYNSQYFLQTAVQYCLAKYSTHLQELLRSGKTSAAEVEQESKRWAELFKEYNIERTAKRSREESTAGEEVLSRKRRGEEVLQVFQARRAENPITMADPDINEMELAALNREREADIPSMERDPDEDESETMKSAYGGLFQDPPYLSSDPDPNLTDPYDKQDCIPSKYLGKNMTFGHPTPGQHPDGYFDKTYLTLASQDQNAGEPTGYRDDAEEKAKMKASQAKISEKEFRYASYPQQSTGPGSYYGCIQGRPNEYMTEPPSDNPPSKKKKEESGDKTKEKLPNIKTSWPKKGTYGMTGTLLENPKYNDNWKEENEALETQAQRRKMRAIPPSEPLGPAFHTSGVSKKYLDELPNTGAPAVYSQYTPSPDKRPRSVKAQDPPAVQQKPFKGSGKRSGQQGCINAFPNVWVDPSTVKESKAKAKAADTPAAPAHGVWKPNSFEKTSVVSSCLRRFY